MSLSDKNIFIKKNNKSIKLLYFYYDPVVIDKVDDKYIILNESITKVPKPLLRFKKGRHRHGNNRKSRE